MVHNNFPKILARREKVQSKVFKVYEADLEFSNGIKKTHEYVRTRGDRAVLAVPCLDRNTVLLMREYSVGVERYELTFPKGIMELGEEPLGAANREMMEEIGYGARKLTILKEMTAIPGYMASKIFCVLAQDLYPQKLIGDEPEPMEVVPWSLDNIDALLQREDFSEGRCIAALLMARDYLKT